VEDEAVTLGELTIAKRQWLGFAPARMNFPIPNKLMFPIGKCADLLGYLGWRSPLRSTALKVLGAGVLGDPNSWLSTGHQSPASLQITLGQIAARSEDRLAARMALLMPLILGVLVAFWAISGVLGVVALPQAASVLTQQGWPSQLANLSVLFWSIVDVLIALGLSVRKYVQRALVASLCVSFIYIVMASLVTPNLWLDPLGPLVKVLPAMALSAVAWMMLDKR